MAAAKSHRYLSGAAARLSSEFSDQFEFDESDVWSSNDTNTNNSETRRSISISISNPNPRPIRKPARTSVERIPAAARSLPVNIPDWAKILRGEYRGRAGEWTAEFEEEDGNDRMPPHEYLARNRAASLSVHEGIGRTLKGRDLSRVRNAIWKKTGFED